MGWHHTHDVVCGAVVGGCVAETPRPGVEARGQAAVDVSAMERVVLWGQWKRLPLLQDKVEERGG